MPSSRRKRGQQNLLSTFLSVCMCVCAFVHAATAKRSSTVVEHRIVKRGVALLGRGRWLRFVQAGNCQRIQRKGCRGHTVADRVLQRPNSRRWKTLKRPPCAGIRRAGVQPVGPCPAFLPIYRSSLGERGEKSARSCGLRLLGVRHVGRFTRQILLGGRQRIWTIHRFAKKANM